MQENIFTEIKDGDFIYVFLSSSLKAGSPTGVSWGFFKYDLQVSIEMNLMGDPFIKIKEGD